MSAWSGKGPLHTGGDTGGAAMGIPASGTEVAITVEPGRGSVQPTTDPIATVDPAELV